MARVCHRCTSTTAVIRCVTETQNLCLTCDYLRHREGDAAGHTRYQICDECMINPALLLCSDHMMVLCQSCYSNDYNCVAYGHHTQVINRFPRQDHNNKNNKNHQHNHHEGHQVGENQRREGMFEKSCKGNNSCEGCMSAVDCESCLASNAVIYCPQHNQLLCDECDRMIHLPEAVLPHLRCQLCVTCKTNGRSLVPPKEKDSIRSQAYLGLTCFERGTPSDSRDSLALFSSDLLISIYHRYLLRRRRRHPNRSFGPVNMIVFLPTHLFYLVL